MSCRESPFQGLHWVFALPLSRLLRLAIACCAKSALSSALVQSLGQRLAETNHLGPDPSQAGKA